MTLFLVSYLRSEYGSRVVEEVLSRAGEERTADELCDETCWSSYAQFRRLLEATATVTHSRDALVAAAADAWNVMATPSSTDMLQSLGSPAALYAMIGDTSDMLVTVVEVSGEEAGPTEWIIRSRFKEGYDPYPEFCSFARGLHSIVPRLFGYPAADVVEEECQVAGAPHCLLRVRWEAIDDSERRADYFEYRATLLESRLEELQTTVADLVASDDLEALLQRILAATARVVGAPGFVLAIKALSGMAERTYQIGLDDDVADDIAQSLVSGTQDDRESSLVIEVASSGASYGWLAAVRTDGGRFHPTERTILEAYGRLAAAALDSATALDDARRQGSTARALLELSSSLARIQAPDEMSVTLTHAMQAVVDCDQAVVLLVDPTSGHLHVTGCAGCGSEAEAQLRALTIEIPSRPKLGEVEYHDPLVSHPVVGRIMTEVAASAAASVAISADGMLLGIALVCVGAQPERLRAVHVGERLLGIASQASIAVRNTRLLDTIRHQALHDSLTGLPNRTLILDRAEQMLSRSRRGNGPVAALFLDLDNFKDINDSLGHDTGDRLLQAVARRLAAAVRDSDTVGRLGGDEFVVLAEGISLVAGSELVAERLQDVLREPFRLNGFEDTPLRVSASIGIAEGQRSSAGDLLRDADVALYRAKANGKNCSAMFLPEMQSEALDRLGLEMDLRVALAENRFFLVYQPVFDLDSSTVCGVEALLRWQHPTRGIVMPDEFIPMLEDNGAIVEVGRWVLDEACQQVALWNAKDWVLTMSINVSMKQLKDAAFVEHVRTALSTSRIQPHQLVIEVTEMAIMREPDATIECLGLLKELGVRVAIDGFGTGYSSLAYLNRFPIDALKIDRSFVSAMADSPESGALVHTLVQLGRTLGLETFAEGIEDSHQLSGLMFEQCERGQGFLFSRPLERDAIEEFLSQQSPRSRALPLSLTLE